MLFYSGSNSTDFANNPWDLGIADGSASLFGHCNDDFSDLRFTQSDGTTKLDYWIESSVSGTSAVVWTEFNSIAASPSTTTFYLYYGNAGASSESNGDNTFPFFDDFSGTFPGTKWTGDTAAGSVSGGILTLTSSSPTTAKRLLGSVSVSKPGALRARVNLPTITSDDTAYEVIALRKSDESNNFVDLLYTGPSTTSRLLRAYATNGTTCNTILDPGANYHIYDLIYQTNSFTGMVDNAKMAGTPNPITTNVPTDALVPYLWVYDNSVSASINVDWVLTRNFTANEPTWGTWGAEEYVVSITNSPSSKAFGTVNASSTYWSNGSAPAFGSGTFLNSTNSSSSTSGGWTNPTNAYADDSSYADITSGTPSANQTYGGYGFNSIPAGSTINSVSVRTDAWSIGASTNRTNSPSSQSGFWNNPTNAYDSAASYTDKTSGTPSANQTYGTYGFNLSTETITSVKVKANAYTTGETQTDVTLTERPTSDNATTGYAPVPASPATLYDKINEVIADHTKYIVGQTNGGATYMANFSAFSVPANAIVNWVAVTFYAVDNSSGTNNVTAAIKVNGTDYGGILSGTTVGVNPGASWVAYTANWTQNPNSSAAWIPGDVNRTSANPLQCVGTIGYDFNPDINVDTLSITVGYTPATVYNELLRAEVSWDGGSTWSATQNYTMTATNATYTYDFTSAVSWNGTYLNDTNFKVRIDAYTVGGASDVRVSWIPVEVIYTALNNEQLNVSVSKDGGTVWSSAYTHNLTGSETTYTDNVTSLGWTISELSDSNFKVAVSGTTVGIDPGDVRLDWIPVEVYYTTGSGLLDSSCFFTINNTGGTTVNLTISSTNATGGNTWTLVSGTPGADEFRLTAYPAGLPSTSNVTLSGAPQSFYTGLTVNSTVKWELKFETPSSFSDAVSHNITITIDATSS